MTLQEVANQFSISKALAYQILHEKIGMSKVSARWVPALVAQLDAHPTGAQEVVGSIPAG